MCGAWVNLTPRAVNDYYFKADINEILVKDLADGANVVWAYASAGSRKPVSAALSLTGLRRAMRWIDCMQAK